MLQYCAYCRRHRKTRSVILWTNWANIRWPRPISLWPRPISLEVGETKFDWTINSAEKIQPLIGRPIRDSANRIWLSHCRHRTIVISHRRHRIVALSSSHYRVIALPPSHYRIVALWCITYNHDGPNGIPYVWDYAWLKMVIKKSKMLFLVYLKNV